MLAVSQKRRPDKNIVLTVRDCEILSTLYHLRVLNTSQIQRLFFAGRSIIAARRRLSLLTHHGYLSSENFSTFTTKEENRYSLTHRGLQEAVNHALESLVSDDGKIMHYTAHRNYVNPTQQIHQLEINEIFVRLVEKGVFNCNSEMPVLAALTSDAWTETRRSILRVGKLWLKPDARVIISDTVYWIEVDRATESIKQIHAKFKRYAELWAQSTLFPGKQHVVLFFCSGSGSDAVLQKRVDAIRSMVLKALDSRLAEDFNVFVDRFEVLSDVFTNYLIPLYRGAVTPSFWRYGLDIKGWGDSKGYDARFNPSYEPFKSSFKPLAWFIYQRPNEDFNWFVVESLLEGSLAAYRRLIKDYLPYCSTFADQRKVPLTCLVIARDIEQIKRVNSANPYLRKVACFTTEEMWQTARNFYTWDNGKLKGEGVLQ